MPNNNDNFSVVLANNQIPVRNIYAVGRNYPAHAKEMGSAVNNDPIFFQKSLTSLHTSAKIIIPRDRNIHHELEVVVLVGTPGEFIDENTAIDHVAGLALGLDLTDRDLQNARNNRYHGSCQNHSRGLLLFQNSGGRRIAYGKKSFGLNAMR